jgi:hypothetical protein
VALDVQTLALLPEKSRSTLPILFRAQREVRKNAGAKMISFNEKARATPSNAKPFYADASKIFRKLRKCRN